MRLLVTSEFSTVKDWRCCSLLEAGVDSLEGCRKERKWDVVPSKGRREE